MNLFFGVLLGLFMVVLGAAAGGGIGMLIGIALAVVIIAKGSTDDKKGRVRDELDVRRLEIEREARIYARVFQEHAERVSEVEQRAAGLVRQRIVERQQRSIPYPTARYNAIAMDDAEQEKKLAKRKGAGKCLA